MSYECRVILQLLQAVIQHRRPDLALANLIALLETGDHLTGRKNLERFYIMEG